VIYLRIISSEYMWFKIPRVLCIPDLLSKIEDIVSTEVKDVEGRDCRSQDWCQVVKSLLFERSDTHTHVDIDSAWSKVKIK
jgi:hypothetical protein